MSALAIQRNPGLESTTFDAAPAGAERPAGPTAGLGWDWASELRDERTWMRRRAAAALAKMPHAARVAVGLLAEAVHDRDPQTRRWARIALENLGLTPLAPAQG